MRLRLTLMFLVSYYKFLPGNCLKSRKSFAPLDLVEKNAATFRLQTRAIWPATHRRDRRNSSTAAAIAKPPLVPLIPGIQVNGGGEYYMCLRRPRAATEIGSLAMGGSVPYGNL